MAIFYRQFAALAPPSALSPHGLRARQLGGTLALGKHEALCLAPVPGLDAKRGEDFSPPPARVMLLPLADLRHVAALTGAALLREDISRAVARPEVQALRDVVGEEAHAFALTRAATYAGHAHRVRLEMQNPQVLAPDLASDRASELAAHWDNLPLPQRVVALGWWCVGACVAAGGPALTARMHTLVPESQAAFGALTTAAEKAVEPPHAAQAAWPPEATQAAWPFIRVLIFKELPHLWEGGWPSFFA